MRRVVSLIEHDHAELAKALPVHVDRYEVIVIGDHPFGRQGLIVGVPVGAFAIERSSATVLDPLVTLEQGMLGAFVGASTSDLHEPGGFEILHVLPRKTVGGRQDASALAGERRNGHRKKGFARAGRQGGFYEFGLGVLVLG